MAKFTCVAAVGPNGQIGANNNLPWHPNFLRGDMSFFKLITMCQVKYDLEGRVESASPAPTLANVVIMGRKTWESIPPKFRPLEGRYNIIVSSKGTDGLCDSAVLADSFEAALKLAEEYTFKTGGQIFIVGGSTLYEAANLHKDCLGTFLTEVEGEMAVGDTFFPVSYLRENYQKMPINEIANGLIRDSCKNVSFDGQEFGEKHYRYRFYFYHKPRQ